METWLWFFPGLTYDLIIYCFGSISATEFPGSAPGISSDQGRDRDETTKSSGISIKAPSINLPKGGGAIKGMGEKFTANPVTGTGSMTVPIATSPGRSCFGTQLSLSYDSDSGNGSNGFGWSLSVPSIMRKSLPNLGVFFSKKPLVTLRPIENNCSIIETNRTII